MRCFRPLLLTVALVLLATGSAVAGLPNPATVVETYRVSIAGAEANDSSRYGSLSADGGIIVFLSGASNLVPGDTNGVIDVFSYDTATKAIARVSVATGGGQANGMSSTAAISGNGNLIVYASDADNLVGGDTNEATDVFSYDVVTGITTRISVTSGGAQANDSSYAPDVSADGSTIVYASAATNLTPGDLNGVADIFAYDVASGITTRVSVSSNDDEADGFSYEPAVSANGGVIAYGSSAANLILSDTNNVDDVFRYEFATGLTTLVSVDSAGNQANGNSQRPAISGDGSIIVYESRATNLADADTNSAYDVFAFDVAAGVTTRVSVDGAGNEANGNSRRPAISTDGQTIAYESHASNLVPGDTNGDSDVFTCNAVGGLTSRISVSSTGAQANGNSGVPAISGNGETIIYQSHASNLVATDVNGKADVFSYDVPTATTTRASLDSVEGYDADGWSYSPSVSDDGSTIVFASSASNLVEGDRNGQTDVFAYDSLTGMTTLISAKPNGYPTDGRSGSPEVSGDGSYIVYVSQDPILSLSNQLYNVYLYDVAADATILVSADATGAKVDESRSPDISADGSTIVYNSAASNLVEGDTNGNSDIFAYDVATGATTRVSVDSNGNQASGSSYRPAISADGGTIVYESTASNLVEGLDGYSIRVFAYDLATGVTTLVSVDSDGNEADGYSERATVSGDGRIVVFESSAMNLAEDGMGGVFAHDMVVGTTSRVVINNMAGEIVFGPSVSADGGTVVFKSDDSDLVDGDTNDREDIFAYNMASGAITRVSVDSAGNQANSDSNESAQVSGDGTLVVYESSASNLVAADTNGHMDVFATRVCSPFCSRGFTAAVPEDIPPGTEVGTVTSVDVGTGPYAHAIAAGNTNGLFAIDPVAGTVTTAKLLDYETATSHTLTVTVTDGFSSDEATVVVNVTDVDEAAYDPFGDDDGSIFEDDIEWLSLSGITKGCNPPVNDMFCPGQYVTRGQMAAFLVRALDLTDPGDVDFVDDDTSIFEADIEKLATAGITRGCNPPINDMFCPGQYVTRGQMAAFLVRALDLTDPGDVDFVDDDTSIFEADIEKLATAGITRGCNPPINDMFCPGQYVTRGQMAAFLHRALGT